MKYFQETPTFVISDSVGKLEVGDTVAANGQFWIIESVSKTGIRLRDEDYDDGDSDNTRFMTAREVDNLHI